MGEGIGTNRFLVGIPDGRKECLKYIGINRMVILRRFCTQWDGGITYIRFRIGTGGGLL